MMVLGLGLFSLITASLSAFLISREEREVAREEERLIEKGEEMIEMEETVLGEELEAIERLERIETRMAGLEEALNRLVDRMAERGGGDKR